MKKIFMLIVLLSSMAMASCDGSGPVTTIDVVLTDFQFSPNTFTVPAGEEITFNSKNYGAVVHDFVIMKLGTNAGDSFDEADAANVYWEVELKPAGEINTSFAAPSEPGEYQIVCRVAGHIMAGMVGKLIVVADE